LKVTTKTGDGGYTGLPSGARVPKDDPRIAFLGAVDELDAFLAGALLAGPSSHSAETISAVRDELFAAVLPALDGIQSRSADIARLESEIAGLEARIHRDSGFVRAWTRPASVALNIARTICRRAEREAVALSRLGAVAPGLSGGERPENGAALSDADGENSCGVYLNRLSDLLFLLALREETA
jgi:cob(I)alamin adenosyltransferase